MQSIAYFHIPDAPESSAVLPVGLSMIDASELNDEIQIFYIDPMTSDETIKVTFYVLGEGDEIADNFPGRFFKRVIVNEVDRFIFFKLPTTERDPIVVEVPGGENE